MSGSSFEIEISDQLERWGKCSHGGRKRGSLKAYILAICFKKTHLNESIL